MGVYSRLCLSVRVSAALLVSFTHTHTHTHTHALFLVSVHFLAFSPQCRVSAAMESLRPYLQTYHLVNFAVILAFPLLRLTPLFRGMLFPDSPPFFNAEEQQVLSVLGIVLTIKARRRQSTDAFMAAVFLYCKTTIAYLLFRSSPVLLVPHLFAWLVQSFAAPAPIVASTSKVLPLTAKRLENLLSGVGSTDYIIVHFLATWAYPCNMIAREYSELAEKHTSRHLSFAKVDVGADKSLADKYNINTSSTSKQLPTFILFHKGKELRRRPFVNANGKVFTTRFSASYLEAEFDLPSIAAGHASVDGPDDGST